MSKRTKYAVSETEKILAPKGVHAARVVRFLELGTQETEWGDKFQCQISYELVDESAVFNEEKGEQNFVVHRTYFRSLSPRSDMGKAVRAVLGDIEDEVEMDDILDGPCQVKIVHTKDGKYANISDVFEANGKVSKSETETQSLYLDENFDQDVFDSLPDWLKDIIRESDEFKECVDEGWAEDEEDEGPKSKKGKRSKDDDEEKPRRKKGRKDEDEEEDKPRSRRRQKDDEDDEEDDKRPARRKRKERPVKKAGARGAKKRPERRARKSRSTTKRNRR